ncbi:MAG: hypothetical protein AB8E15_01295 [Bdellovibrionales bacterium]
MIASSVTSIQDATREQEEGVNQVSITMKQIDQTTQQNSNLANLASSHSESVQGEAIRLEDIMREVSTIVIGDKIPTGVDLSGKSDNQVEGVLNQFQTNNKALHSTELVDEASLGNFSESQDIVAENDIDNIDADDDSFEHVG